LDDLAVLFTNKIINAANLSIPKTNTFNKAKPWWNEELKSLRKAMQKLYRKSKASGYSLYKRELLDSKNLYFNTIKKTRNNFWNSFLEKEDSQSIFKAMAYIKDINN